MSGRCAKELQGYLNQQILRLDFRNLNIAMTVAVQQQLLANGNREELEDCGACRSENSENCGNVGALYTSSHDIIEFFDELTDFGDEFNKTLRDQYTAGGT
jgi:hypothetical protein